jgi:hypothetical protein
VGPEGLSPWVKQMGLEADHSPPFNVEVKNGEVIPPLSKHFHGVELSELSTGTTSLHSNENQFLQILPYM